MGISLPRIQLTIMPTIYMPWSRFPNPGGERRWLTPRQWVIAILAFVLLLGASAAVVGPMLARAWHERSLQADLEELRREEYRQTWQGLEQAVQSDPENLAARRQLAEFYDEAGLPLALDEWRAIIHLDPANQANRLALAQCAQHLGQSAGGKDAAGDRRLEELARGDSTRIRATLELIRKATRTGSPRSIEALARKVLPPASRPGLISSWLFPRRAMDDLIAYMVAQPQPGPGDVVALAEWMCRQGMAREALSWVDGLSPSLRATPQVQGARATCMVRLKSWRGVESAVRAGAWGAVPGEALDLAFTAHTLRELRLSDQAADKWSRALDVAGRSEGGLRILLRLASELQWQDEAEAALWRLAGASPGDTANWEQLAALATAEGSTQKLLDVYKAWAKTGQDNAEATGGVAWLSALLDRSAEGVMEASNLSNPGFVVAEALRLHRSGRGADGLALLDTLPQAAQGDVRPSLVRGLLLSDLGQRAESEHVLARIPESQLLPEERALLEAAHVRNGGTASP
jgi:tetratricopeptide (TPR) repeat protein